MFSYFFVALLKEGGALVLCRATTPTEQLLFSKNTWRFETDVVGVEATSDAPYALGTEYTCDLGDGERTFYVLKEDGENVKLLMNENLGDRVAWAESGDNSEGPVTATAYLASQTSGWTTLTSVGGTVSLVDAQDIADALGNTSWNDSASSGFIFTGSDWMIVNLDGSYPGENGPFGYWTSTATSYSGYAWSMEVGALTSFEFYVDTIHLYGVRPVITISKENMSL